MALARELGASLDVLVSDLLMPEMNGEQLATELLNRHPQLRVLYVSGYTADVIAERSGVGAEIELQAKPYTQPQLVDRIERLFENSGEAGPEDSSNSPPST